MNKRLIQCPRCEIGGKKQVLGEIDNDGFFTVMRFHKGTTKIISNQFAVVCGVCNEYVFFRRTPSGIMNGTMEKWINRNKNRETSWNKNRPWSIEMRKKISDSLKGYKGIKHTKRVKLLMSKIKKEWWRKRKMIYV